MEVLPTTFELSEEQRDTAALLNELLGQAISARYQDFCRLSAGVFALNVSVPIAAHALRELESMLRSILEVPMDAVAAKDPAHRKRTRDARKLLRGLGFDKEAIDRAVKGLEPRLNHKNQIRKIVTRLGFDPDGDIANLWTNLTDTNEMVHGRSFHEALKVDDDFRTIVQQPFDSVIRAVAIALRIRYAALMRHVDELACSTRYVQALKSFRAEIPGAPQLQWRFYTRLATGAWIPHLLKAGLFGEPISHLPEVGSDGTRHRDWPAGSYLRRMAESTDTETRQGVVAALRSVAASDHPDIRQTGIAILAALPAAESAPLVDLAVAWIGRGGGASFLLEPDKLVKKLAGAGESVAAMDIARELLRLWDANGQLASHHSQHMYEHHLPELTAALTAACGIDALRLLIDLLRQAVTISDSARYGFISTRSIAESDGPPNDILEALVNAILQSADLLMRNKRTTTLEVVRMLEHTSERIFIRLCLYFLARDPSSARKLSSAYLMNEELISETWSRAEYDALAIAWFPSLTPRRQAKILAFVDTLPAKYHSSWRARFEALYKRPPTTDEEEAYRIGTVSGVLWDWRSVLPPDRKAAIEQSGDPHPPHFPRTIQEESPLTASDFCSAPITDIITFLKDWRPGKEPHRQTMTALAQGLHSAAFTDPKRFSAGAHEFACLQPIYIRQLLDGLQYGASNQNKVDWDSILGLIAYVLTKEGEAIDPSTVYEGDDKTWDWVIKSAAKMLVVGLRLGSIGIPRVHIDKVRSLILTFLALPSKAIDVDRFDERFTEHPFFTAQDTSRGIATELCVLLTWWTHLDLGSSGRPMDAISSDPLVANALSKQLTDRSATGRIPRAVIGRYLQMTYYVDHSWLKSHVAALFPANDDALRNAAWSSHLMNDRGPVRELMSDLQPCYIEEIDRLSVSLASPNDNEQNVRQRRFASYVMVLVLEGVATTEVLDQFLTHATSTVRRAAMWYVGGEISKPLAEVPESARQYGIAFWERRLAAAKAATDRSQYREELGAIGRWCFLGVVDEVWLCDQLIAMAEIGLAPNDWHGVTDWLQKVAMHHIDRAVEVLLGLVRTAGVAPWVYMAAHGAIRIILTEGRNKGTQVTINHVSEIVNRLASLGETSYLDLDPPTPNP